VPASELAGLDGRAVDRGGKLAFNCRASSMSSTPREADLSQQSYSRRCWTTSSRATTTTMAGYQESADDVPDGLIIRAMVKEQTAAR
jgi:hypothetical protein